jgi:fluoride exporter
MTKDLTILALLGALGTLARYGISGWVQRLSGTGFPWGTLAVNALGCILLGIVWTLAEERLVISGQTRGLLLIGFMGAFTTFSSYAFETVQLLRDGEMLLALGNIAVQNVLCLFCVVAGMAVGRALF